MEITRRTDYAIRMLIALARVAEGQSCSARELSMLQRVPHPLARGILSELARAGFVKTRRGSGGGVELARPATEITVLSVVECLEGPVTLGLCTTDTEYCDRADECVMHSVWMTAEEQLRDLLASRSLAYLAFEVQDATDQRESSPATREPGGDAVT